MAVNVSHNEEKDHFNTNIMQYFAVPQKPQLLSTAASGLLTPLSGNSHLKNTGYETVWLDCYANECTTPQTGVISLGNNLRMNDLWKL